MGMVSINVPVAVKSKSPERCPSWKIHTMAPKVAERLATLNTRALSGMNKLRKSRSSMRKVAPTTSRTA